MNTAEYLGGHTKKSANTVNDVFFVKLARFSTQSLTNPYLYERTYSF